MTAVSRNPAPTLGLASLVRNAGDGAAMQALGDHLIARITEDPDDVGALLDLSTVLLVTGHREKGLELQAQAIARQPCYRQIHGAGGGLRVLVFMAPGDLMANTPVDFLLEESDVELLRYYVDGAAPSPLDIPDHDMAIVAVGQSDENEPALMLLQTALAGWPRRVLNNRPERIAALTRDGVARRFAGDPLVLAPGAVRAGRESLGALPPGMAFPILVRPAGSHAGQGLEKIDDPQALAAYVTAQPAAEFYVSQFVDYSGADGLFRKLRIVFIQGRPFVSHMAVSPRWMVHYLNADMDTNPANRAEEARMMETFDEGFAARHAKAFASLTGTLGLDYFGIDCGEARDGRLLLFEADVAMIVHAMDSAELYPYKQPAMTKLFAGFIDALTDAARTPEPAA